VKISPQKLKKEILPTGGQNTYVRIHLSSGELVGNVFGTRWVYKGRPVLWITQLCVHSSYRNQGIAKQLLRNLYQEEYCVWILPSHPFAISAVLQVFGSGVDHEEPMDALRIIEKSIVWPLVQLTKGTRVPHFAGG
jgi:GNAT superfamily N-acetyltransferase